MKMLKNQKGFTLVEISIGFLIMTIVMVMSLSIVMFSNNMFVRSSVQKEIKVTADDISNYIENKISKASSLEILYTNGIHLGNINSHICTNAKYENIIAVIDGDLYAGTKSGGVKKVYSVSSNDLIYKNGSMKLQASKNPSKNSVVNLNLKLEGDLETEYDIDYAINLFTLETLAASFSTKPVYSVTEYHLHGATITDTNIISYDTLYDPFEDERDGGGAYTIDEKYYPVWPDVDILTTFDPTKKYNNGDYVYIDEKLYIVNSTQDWGTEGSPMHSPGTASYAWWTEIKNDGNTSTGNAMANKHDTVKVGTNYVMSKMNENVFSSSLSSTDINDLGRPWVPVYWFPEKQEYSNTCTVCLESRIDFSHTDTYLDREKGWSLSPRDDTYTYDAAGNKVYSDPNRGYECAVDKIVAK